MAVKKSELYSALWDASNKLRGGVEPSRYKDYVLVLLFFKYVSDKYKDDKYAMFKVTDYISFDHLIQLKGKPNIGEEVDKVIQSFLEHNALVGLLPDVSFNNQAELGEGKELVDKITGLISIFENPALDFKSNRASGDDIIGDAYEFLMMKFAQESGKSKGQFYTPAEVSRVVAKLIGINKIKETMNKKWEAYDPACGSGSLLIRVADEAPKNKNGDSLVSIYGQEKYPDTAGLAKMNFILHNKSTGEVRAGNTLVNPKYKDRFDQLKKFDFVVMNPPFSDKAWSDGLNPENDEYGRFEGYGFPPEKNGDYAWFLHVLKSLNPTGKAGIILPHGVLFRGNAEEIIRKEIVDRKYIKGIVGLPANLFYGTGIPASIILVDKEDAENREGIFFIDASKGFVKEGDKNRLREQDIEKIVQSFENMEEIPGYSRYVSYDEIIEKSYNLNIPRYIQSVDTNLPHSIIHHLKGGIPEQDIDSLVKLWNISPSLKNKIFSWKDDVYYLAVTEEELDKIITADSAILEEISKLNQLFDTWSENFLELLYGINEITQPKELIQTLSHQLLQDYKANKLIDEYVVYECLLNYWNETMQDDVYVIKTSGYQAGREVEVKFKQNKGKDTKTINGINGILIPSTLIETEYFSEELATLETISQTIEQLSLELGELIEKQSDENSLFENVLNTKGDSISRNNLKARLTELEGLKESNRVKLLERVLKALTDNDDTVVEAIMKENPYLEGLDLRNKTNGRPVGKKKVKDAIKLAQQNAKLPIKYQDEYSALVNYEEKLIEKETQESEYKALRKELFEAVIYQYSVLTIEEIQQLIIRKKWFETVKKAIVESVDQEINTITTTVTTISHRYSHNLKELEKKTSESEQAVKDALKRMGYQW